MPLSYAPVQQEDVPAGGLIYRISYGVEYGRPIAPRFVYKVELIEDGPGAGDMGLRLPDRPHVAMRVAEAISEFIARPHPL